MRHESGPEQIEQATGVMSGEEVKVGNPDEIVIEDDLDEVGEPDAKAPSSEKAADTKVEEPTTRATIIQTKFCLTMKRKRLSNRHRHLLHPPHHHPHPLLNKDQVDRRNSPH